MRLDFQADDTWSYLHYNNFSIGSANEKYPLTVGGFTGMGHDAYTSGLHNGMKFSTLDEDNDKSSSNYAVTWKRGWWYNSCGEVTVNTQPPNLSRYGNDKLLFSEMKMCLKDSCIMQ